MLTRYWLVGYSFPKPQVERLGKQNQRYTLVELGLHSLQPPSLVQCHVHTWEVHMEYLSYKQIPRCATVSSSNGSVSSLC